MYKSFLVIAVILLLTGSGRLSGQDLRNGNDSIPLIGPNTDSTQLLNESDTLKESNVISKPQIAASFAAVLPGLGQIYNKRYWKLPILYGGAAVSGYLIYLFNQKYQQFREAYLQRKSLPPELFTSPLAKSEYSNDIFQNAVESYRKYRDQTMIVMAGIYFLQIVDAYVDAQLMDFDISEDLSLHLGPDFQSYGYLAGNQYGIKLTLIFN